MNLSGPVKIVGCGLIGTSIALRLKENGIKLILADTNERNLNLASDLVGIEEVDANPELVVFAIPPDRVFDTVKEQFVRYPDAMFIDVTGIKSKLLNKVDSFLELSRNYVSVHPMAGRETSGPESARSDLFVSRAWIVSKSGSSTQAALSMARELGALMGSTIYELDAERHDSVIGSISHLPQIVSSVLGATLNDVDMESLNLAGQGLRDVSRLAESDPELWSGLLLGNADQILPKIGEVINRLSILSKALETNDETSVKSFLQQGRDGRNRIPGKHGQAKRDYTYLPIVIDDKPGGLARIFNECAELDVNVEDLSIEHSPGQAVGLVTLALSSADAFRLQKHLVAKGWLAHTPRES